MICAPLSHVVGIQLKRRLKIIGTHFFTKCLVLSISGQGDRFATKLCLQSCKLSHGLLGRAFKEKFIRDLRATVRASSFIRNGPCRFLMRQINELLGGVSAILVSNMVQCPEL